MSAEDVRFRSDGCLPTGIFTEAAQPVAAPALLSGSGRSDRDSDVRLPGGRMLRVGVMRALADTLAGARVSSLRYDKRGVGASDGDALRVGMADGRADARAGLGWLADRAPGLPLLAVGHSEGAWYAAELAADGAVAGVVLLAAGARPAEQVLAWQAGMLAARLPRLLKVVRVAGTDAVAVHRRRVARIRASRADVVSIQGRPFNARWFRDFLVGQLVRGPFEGHVVGDLSHLLRPDPSSIGPRGYRRAVRQPVSPEALALVAAWVGRHWGRAAAGAAS